ncbi:branched-chain amino acid transport ATP-binding protein LivF [Desulfocucumis palustris]|uniref:Branched-chain amino acid transport ATP-binding protein LivF n=1 Tax=Desulfocucumis palustris TaxID=1898651 RepID=A0A2L2X8R9_9FIRM|nr:ABC transporter ATP-binding protein [Desulfocucumis palustris]GBF32410.1 branched-chain amino acid transport ATP-binding protein LivF [Desulfocucumis palustris]
MLELKDVVVHYGVVPALKGISFRVEEGEIVTLIGANGAGKSTTLKAISGLLKLKEGSITYQGGSISGKGAHMVVRQGISQVPEGRGIFANLTVEENLSLGAYTRKDKSKINENLKNVYERFPRLQERRKQVGGTLSGGEQQMLAIGRALMATPKLLLLDEPSMGLAPLVVREIFKIIREINKMGTTILLVEQNARMALSVAGRGYVLETGQIISEGSASELRGNEEVKKAYLGH